ncbi:MAG: glycosyltransferase family 4 protein [Candidatus Aminicenantaceae bacterium]
MKIAYITPGSGDNFYCQNCFRDDELLTSMLVLGQDVRKIPMYLPSGLNHSGVPGTPVFYGAINLYLREKMPIYRHAPSWLERAFDSQAMLRYAAKKSGSTSASGLEGMTISMLHGEEGRQASELENLIQYLRDEIKPDVVHLSNALLLGLARRIKQDVRARVVCSLQDENEWVDEMDGSQQPVVWSLMAEKARDVDLFIATSRYYSEKSQRELDLPAERIEVINGGINLQGYERSELPFDPPVIGYLCRMSEYFGLGIVVDAFLELKQDTRFKNLRLHMAGGYTGLDKPFVDRQVARITEQGWQDDIRIFGEFDKKNRIPFLKSLTLLSVPVPSGEAFGAYQVESLAAGVPVVQPDVGCYPEFVEATQGGIIYKPNTGEALAAAAASLLQEPERVRRMGERGRSAVMADYSMNDMAKNILKIYERILNHGG